MLHPDTHTLQKIKPASRLEESGVFWLMLLPVVIALLALTPIGHTLAHKIGHDIRIVAANTYSQDASKQTLLGDLSHESKAYVQMIRKGNPITTLQHARQHAINAGAARVGGQVNDVVSQVNAAGAAPSK